MDSFYHGGDTQTIFNLIGESLFENFYLSYSEKCPSEHNTQKVSFRTQYLKKCPSEHAAMCPSKHELCVLPNMKLELRNKGSPLQLAPKPTYILRMGPKAPNMRVVKIQCAIDSIRTYL